MQTRTQSLQKLQENARVLGNSVLDHFNLNQDLLKKRNDICNVLMCWPDYAAWRSFHMIIKVSLLNYLL